MLEELSQHQKDMIHVYRDRSMKIGLATGKTEDRPTVEKVINKFYEYSNLKHPEMVLYVRSPREALRLINYLKSNEHRLDEFASTFNSNADAFVAAMLENAPTDNLTHHAPSVHGNHETHWLQYYDYYRKECSEHVKYDEDKDAILTDLITFAERAGWLYTFERVAIVVDRPSEILLENSVVHNDKGAAVTYEDGFKIYSVGGHRIDAWIIENPELITVQKIKDESNAETKRIMIDQYGVDKYLMDVGGEVLDMDCLNLEGSVPRTLFVDNEGSKWLVGTDGSTGRVYHMPVPEEATTCTEAHSMIAGFDSDNNCKFEC